MRSIRASGVHLDIDVTEHGYDLSDCEGPGMMHLLGCNADCSGDRGGRDAPSGALRNEPTRRLSGILQAPLLADMA